uniref:Uncharacterized protein n=1 Tax=Rhodnius prolixus TaxID=13249 RepID=T1HZP1_RHOPR
MAYTPYYPQYYRYPQEQQPQFMFSSGYSNYLYAPPTQILRAAPYPQTLPSRTYFYANPFQSYPNYGCYPENIGDQSLSFMSAKLQYQGKQLQRHLPPPNIVLQSKTSKDVKPVHDVSPVNKEKPHSTWWKVYLNKEERERPIEHSNTSGSNIGLQQVMTRIHSNKYELSAVYDGDTTKDSRKVDKLPQTMASVPSKNSIRVIKKEDDNIISNQQTSEELFPIINATSKTLNNFTEDIKKQLSVELDKQLIKNDNQENQAVLVGEKKNQEMLNNHCREILSKFVLNETSNEYNAGIGIIDYNDLGNDLNKTMQFILREIHSIDAASNYLSLKLTPRQKQDVAALIIDELNKLHIPGDKWGRICTLVVNALNQNFKEFFEKKKFHKESSCNNSWLWLLETANNF